MSSSLKFLCLQIENLERLNFVFTFEMSTNAVRRRQSTGKPKLSALLYF
jgi:hypothetical protein